MKFVIAIDGPAGTGKSSVAKAVAKKLKMIYVDTGAIYRALAFIALKKNIDKNDAKSLVKLIPLIKIVVDEREYCTNIMIDDQIITDELRSENISKLSSIVSTHKEVREGLLKLQRDLVNLNSNGSIFEGRDIGTVVFPKANLKIFVNADAKTRANRRFFDISKTNPGIKYDDILKAIEKRDESDENRKISPLKKADDGVLLDTSNLTQEQVEEKMLDLIVKAQKKYQEENKSC